MPDGVVLTKNGAVSIGSTGRIATTGCICPFCQTTPAEITLVISGIPFITDPCPVLPPYPYSQFRRWDEQPTPFNGTFTLRSTQMSANECQWSETRPASGLMRACDSDGLIYLFPLYYMKWSVTARPGSVYVEGYLKLTSTPGDANFSRVVYNIIRTPCQFGSMSCTFFATGNFAIVNGGSATL